MGGWGWEDGFSRTAVDKAESAVETRVESEYAFYEGKFTDETGDDADGQHEADEGRKEHEREEINHGCVDPNSSQS
jgi:hypothetical protein